MAEIHRAKVSRGKQRQGTVAPFAMIREFLDYKRGEGAVGERYLCFSGGLPAQISRKEATAILSISATDLDRLRKTDPWCLFGLKKTDSQMASVKFRLSNVYTHSEALRAESVTASSLSR